jgi:hypothetical protein
MGLTLEYVERAPHGTRWLEALRNPQPDTAGPDTYSLQSEPWQWRDSVVILAAVVFLVVLSCA